MRFPSMPPESRIVTNPLYKKNNGGWFETTAIFADGKDATGYFKEVEPVVGGFLVYADYRGADGKTHDGHIGIISEIDPGKSGIQRVKKIIHCSLGGWTGLNDAVQETGPDHWLGHPSIAVWYEGFSDPYPAPGTAAAMEMLAATPGGPQETAATPPDYRSLTPGGSFSKDPMDMKVPRSIRTNNPGALNDRPWQKAFPGYVGVTGSDHVGNVTSIWVTPEHGIAAWHYLFTDRYGYGEHGTIVLQQLAMRYAGVNLPDDPAVQSYIKGWKKFSPALTATSQLSLADDGDMLALAKGMFGHEAGKASPLHDDQVTTALELKRAGKLPGS
jgi:hypothetical protein